MPETQFECDIPIANRKRNTAPRLRVLAKIRRDRRSKFNVLEYSVHFPRCLNRRRKFLIELRRIPVHFGQRENVPRKCE